MDEHVYGHSPYRIERIQYPQGVGCAEPKNIFAFANYCKRLPIGTQSELDESVNDHIDQY